MLAGLKVKKILTSKKWHKGPNIHQQLLGGRTYPDNSMGYGTLCKTKTSPQQYGVIIIKLSRNLLMIELLTTYTFPG
jgi:hypothetical protein